MSPTKKKNTAVMGGGLGGWCRERQKRSHRETSGQRKQSCRRHRITQPLGLATVVDCVCKRPTGRRLVGGGEGEERHGARQAVWVSSVAAKCHGGDPRTVP